MGITTYFFDTYSFHEIIDGNPKYASFIVNIGIVTTKLNLMELYYGLLRRLGKSAAEKSYDNLVKYTIELDDDTIKQAMEFRMLQKNKKFSYIDCIGYVLAEKNNIKFLTGDEAFRGLSNVEFVK